MQRHAHKISINKMTFFAILLFVVSIIPLLILGRYNVMCADDYSNGIEIHDIWLSTGSVWQCVKSAVEFVKRDYFAWQGTFASGFLMVMCPMNFDYKSTFLVPIIMIGMCSLSVYLLGKQIFLKWFGGDAYSCTFILFMILFMYFQVMDTPYDGIYWYNGATHYVLMESFFFLVLSAVLAIIWTEIKKNSIIWSVLGSIGGLMVGGGNLVTALQAEIVLGFLLGYICLKDRNKILYVSMPFLCATIGFLINVLAPGNTARGGVTEGYSALMSIALSFYYAGIYIMKWTRLLVLLVWIAALPAMWKIGSMSEKSFKYPGLVTLGVLCILAAMFTPTLYALGEAGAGLARVNNIIQLVYYLGIFVVTTYWFGWFTHRKNTIRKHTWLTSKSGGIMLIAGLFVLLVWMFTPNKNTYTGISALRSLVNGDARVFYAEEMERYEMYTDDSISDVIVMTHSVSPYLFDVRDVSWDVDNWINVTMAHYYHKNSIMRLVNTVS